MAEDQQSANGFVTSKESELYQAALEGESDRGFLLVGLSQIDYKLGELLRLALTAKGANADADWLLDPKAGNRPLGALAIRTRVAYCLGLIDDPLRNILDGLRGLRNAHAHGTVPFTLLDKYVDPLLAETRKTARIQGGDEFIESHQKQGLTSARAKMLWCFVFSVAEIAFVATAGLYLNGLQIQPTFPVESDNKANKPGVK